MLDFPEQYDRYLQGRCPMTYDGFINAAREALSNAVGEHGSPKDPEKLN